MMLMLEWLRAFKGGEMELPPGVRAHRGLVRQSRRGTADAGKKWAL